MELTEQCNGRTREDTVVRRLRVLNVLKVGNVLVRAVTQDTDDIATLLCK